MNGELALWTLTLASGALERVLTRLLTRDPQCRELLAKLDGKVIAVHGLPVSERLYLLPFPAGIQIDTDFPAPPDLTVTGNPATFAKIALRGLQRSDLGGGSLGFSGDPVVAQQLRELLAASAINWPQLIADVVPAPLANSLVQPIRALRDWGAGSMRSLELDIGEFLSEEVRDVTTAPEAREFCVEVDHLRDDVERIEARIERLQCLVGVAAPGAS